MEYNKSISESVGNTPLLRLDRIKKSFGLNADIYAKLEFLNPAGSIKDRAALFMINEAEKAGLICPGAKVIEPTSGNTGIGLAAICAERGYHCIIVMPDSMSKERMQLIKAHGAELVLTPGSEGMAGAVKKAEEIKALSENCIIAGQFDNPANPLAHYMTTGPEIYRQLDSKVDAFVASAGTGGTICGTGRYLKEQNSGIVVYSAEPAESNLLNGGKAGAHGIQGIGANFIPKNFDPAIVDKILEISTEEAAATARLVAEKEGILIGFSGGCNLAAAIRLAKEPRMAGKNIVTVFPDSGEKYLSTALFD